MKHFTELTSSAERIVDVAEALIRERGFNGFSYEDIAREVGIRKPSIHHHFAAKADLGAVVAQRYTHRFHERLVQIEQAHADPAERLHAYAGLFQQNYENAVRQLPGAGDIPVLGALFRSSRWRKQETELVIIVTPRLAVANDFRSAPISALAGREPST